MFIDSKRVANKSPTSLHQTHQKLFNGGCCEAKTLQVEKTISNCIDDCLGVPVNKKDKQGK